MRHFLGGVLAVCSLAVFAQDAPKAEIFAGFSYANYELLPATGSFSNSSETISGSSSGRLGLIGWNASVAVNMNRWFSFATDVSGYYSGSSASTTTTQTIFNTCGPVSCPPQTITNTNVASSPKIYNFLFGPQFSYPARKIRPFAHFLVGGQHSDVTRSESVTDSSGSIISSPPISLESGSTGFAMAIGGGVDYSIKRTLAWRIASDYLTNQGTGQNHVRVSTGLVWRLGS
jgi:hypothetical protein